MRTIKFRAWDKWENRMYESCKAKSWEIIFTPIKQWCEDCDNWFYPFYSEHLDLMQYTWLKDKNWVEIYEGDVITLQKVEWKEKTVWIVRYNNQTMSFRQQVEYLDNPNSVWESSSRKISYVDTIEVIWNIYENPELLTNKE